MNHRSQEISDLRNYDSMWKSCERKRDKLAVITLFQGWVLGLPR